MSQNREEAVRLVNEANDWTDLQPDSHERMDEYDAAERLIKEYREAHTEELDAASRAASAANELHDRWGIYAERDL